MSKRSIVRSAVPSTDQPDAPAKSRPLSPAELEARRKNARLSTGPNTPEGKQASRVNAWKHGFRASVALDSASQNELGRRNAQLEADIRPVGGTERLLVREVAWASVRLDRLRDEDEAAYSARRRSTLDAIDQARESSVAALVDRLRACDPAPLSLKGFGPNTPPLPLEPIDRASLIAGLESTSEGCAALADLWDELANALAPGSSWTIDHARHMLRLLGHTGEPPENKANSAFGHWLDAATLASDRSERERLACSYKVASPNEDVARERLEALARGRSERLAERCERLWRERDSIERTEALRAAATGGDATSQLRHRYMAAASSQMHRALRMLDHIRNSNRLCLAIDLDESPPPPPPPPPPPASPPDDNGKAPAPNEPKIIQGYDSIQDTFNRSYDYIPMSIVPSASARAGAENTVEQAVNPAHSAATQPPRATST